MNRVLFPAAVLFSMLAVVGSAAAQTTAYFPDNSPAVGATNAFPFNTGNYTTVMVYPAAGLTAAGIVAGQQLSAVAIAPSSAIAAGTFTCTNAQIWIGHAATTPTIANQWLNNLAGAQPVWNTANDGLLSFSRQGGSWAQLPFSANCVFIWDGVRDLVLYMSMNSVHTGGFTLCTSPTAYTRHGVSQQYPAPGVTQTTTGVLAGRAKFDFFPAGPPAFQLNQAGAGFTLDGVAGSAYGARTLNTTANNVCTFGSTNIAFSSSPANTGNPWDLAVTSGPAVSGAGPGFQTGGGQFVNIDLVSPTLFFLNGFAFTTPFPGNFGFAFAPGGPFVAGSQFVVIDGAQVDGFSLSQPNNYNCAVVAVPASPAMPTGDDAAVVCSYVSACGACSFTFFGTTYTQFGVTTNGRVMPGNNAVTSFTPIQVPVEPTIGAWCDLNTTVNGSIVLSSPAAGIARVDYNAVGFHLGTVGTNGVTLGIEMDCATGNITMDSFLLAAGTTNQFVGIAKGVGGTDPGPAGPFDGSALGAYGGPGLPTDNIYSFGLEGSGVVNNLAALVFTPSTTGGSYDWTQY